MARSLGEGVRAISLLYHDLVAGDPDSSGFPGGGPGRYKLEVSEFRRHVAALRGALGRAPSAVTELLDGTAPQTPRLLTVDDGGVSAILFADLIEEDGWRAHFLVTTDYIGRPGFLDPAQIRDLRRRGHTIGSHSCSHPDPMSGCGDAQLLSEWGRSLGVLSDLLGERVRVASVPGGYYSSRVGRAASLSGVEALFNSEPTTRPFRVDRCLVLGRYTLWRGMSPETAAALARGERGERSRQWVMWNAKKLAKTIGGRHYLRLRRLLLGRSQR